MTDASSHVHLINNLLKNIKSSTRAEYIQPCPGGLSIATNNVPAPSDLTLIERYIKSIDGINNDEVLTPRLPQSKSYLKITRIPYIQPNGNRLTSEDIINFIASADIFETISLASKPRVIKASPKLDMAIIWIDIWDSQNGAKAKLLINHSFNYR